MNGADQTAVVVAVVGLYRYQYFDDFDEYNFALCSERNKSQ